MENRYAVGIDLGTSNSALALAPEEVEGGAEVLPVTQLISFQGVGELDMLPSVLYLPLENQAASAAARLPWEEDPLQGGVVGQFAREQGALMPDRMVASAKSWLCNPHVNPEEPLLPWSSPLESGRKVSPFEASVRYLRHLRHAFEAALRDRGRAPRAGEGEVVVTVPASFDDVARALTHRAALAAGWGEVTLLEEQQAAFYYWISQSAGRWREQVRPGDLVLICDVGGGTADFSLVAVSEKGGELQLERVSVGDHILLGGDNMDLALAHALKGELEGAGERIDTWQFLSLIHSCRVAKEALFDDPGLPCYPISIPSRSASLFAGTLSCALRRETLDAVVLDGFFPKSALSEHPARRRTLGRQEKLLEKVLPRLSAATETAEPFYLAGSLERIALERKLQVVQLLSRLLVKPQQASRVPCAWALGRLLSRVPLYAGPDAVLPPGEVAKLFLELRDLNWKDPEYAPLNALFAQAARRTGRRGGDLPDELLQEILLKMQGSGARPEELQVVRETVPVRDADRVRQFGESLPSGLVLVKEG